MKIACHKTPSGALHLFNYLWQHMKIAVNTRLLLPDNLEGIGYFIREVFTRMAINHPEHQFFFFFDRNADPSLSFPPNVQIVEMGPPARHPLLWKIWFDIVIPRKLKAIQADVFVSPDGFCSLHTRVPQCMVVHDLGFLHQPKAYKNSHLKYLRYYTPRFLKKAACIATVSAFSRDDIMHQNPRTKNINIVYSAVKEGFHPANFELQNQMREKYTGGKQFFIYVGALQPRKNLVNLLKAFSIFKKRLKSEMKMVFCGRLAWKNNEFLELLKTYKYRDDVVLTGYLPEKELVALVGASYAMVYPSFFEGFGVPVLEAMHCGVPALTSAHTSMQEIGEDAALYFDPSDAKDMGEKLMLIYKDENLRNKLIQRGNEIKKKYSWERTAQLLWQSVEEAAGK